jgi:hypothetical protein
MSTGNPSGYRFTTLQTQMDTMKPVSPTTHTKIWKVPNFIEINKEAKYGIVKRTSTSIRANNLRTDCI